MAAIIVTGGTAEASTLTVAWDPSANPTVVGYKVAYGITSGAYTNEIDTGSQTVFQVGNLTAGGTYFFVVRAYDGAGNLSAPSSEVKGIAPLSTPLSVTCQAKAATSADGSPVAIKNTPTASGGVSPITTTCAPQSGSLFTVGTTSVQCTAKDAAGVTASCAGAVVVTLAATASSPLSVSPEGTHVPSASQIVDAAGAIYTLKNASPFPVIMRNGTQLAGGFGTAIAWCGGRIYVHGDDSQWYLFDLERIDGELGAGRGQRSVRSRFDAAANNSTDSDVDASPKPDAVVDISGSHSCSERTPDR